MFIFFSTYPPLLFPTRFREVTYEQGGVKVCSDIPEDMQPSSEEEERLQKTRGEPDDAEQHIIIV